MRLSSLVVLASGSSKTYRSLLLAVSSSTINKLSEYIIFKLPPFCDHRVFVRMLPESLNCQRDQDQMRDSVPVGKYRSAQHLQHAGYSGLDL
jgi:hypothetical protein